MRNPTLNEELFYSSNDTLIFFYSTECINKECNYSKASKEEQESNTNAKTNQPTKYHKVEYHHQTNNSTYAMAMIPH